MERLLRFSEEHEIFRNSFRSWLEKEVVPFHDQWEKARLVPRSIWKRAGELGFLGPTIPEEYGGAGGDFLYSVIETEEIERVHATGLGGIPLQNDIISPYIREHGTEEQKQRYLPGCASGDTILAVAMTEPNAGSDLAAIQCTALKDGDHYVINGQKTFISNGQHCDLIVVVAKTDPRATPAHAGISLVLVDATNPGFKRGRNLEKVGLHAQDTSEMFFEDCRVPRSALLGTEEGRGFYQLMHELQQERLICAVGAQAAAELALKESVKYSCERRAFGKRIADFQHNSFKLAEMATQVELGRCFVDRLVTEHMQGKPLLSEVSMAKYWITDMLCRVVDDGVQLHGGYGYMLEYPIGKMYQDVRVQRIFAGSNEIMKLIIARQLLGRG